MVFLSLSEGFLHFLVLKYRFMFTLFCKEMGIPSVLLSLYITVIHTPYLFLGIPDPRLSLQHQSNIFYKDCCQKIITLMLEGF